MDFDSIRIRLNELVENISKLKEALNIEGKKQKISELEKKTLEDGFWDDNKNSSAVLQEIKNLNAVVEKISLADKKYNEICEYAQMAEELNDFDSYKEAVNILNDLEKEIQGLKIQTLFSDEFDANNAIVTIHPGAGGTESQDWALMLYRMYTKWASLRSDFEIEILDMQDADDAGIKSVSFIVKGMYAYGHLKGEKGVHRLVRISPFDANSRRHTSFAAVDIMPELQDDIKVDIRSEDLEVDTYRASGAGGQHVNKTESAIRIKHVPTGIVVACQTERSQIQNRENAMKMLKSKIYQYEKQKQEIKIKGIKGDISDNAWGNQIRSYVFCPYTLAKDHRTNFEIGNIQAVMDGKIDEFMYEYLKYIKNNDII
ncbi:MAG: peptide chain release factor 2 [Clostridia bacterium]|nr:peptide chain release factor 2 [Clostridia bacterium]